MNTSLEWVDLLVLIPYDVHRPRALLYIYISPWTWQHKICGIKSKQRGHPNPKEERPNLAYFLPLPSDDGLPCFSSDRWSSNFTISNHAGVPTTEKKNYISIVTYAWDVNSWMLSFFSTGGPSSWEYTIVYISDLHDVSSWVLKESSVLA